MARSSKSPASGSSSSSSSGSSGSSSSGTGSSGSSSSSSSGSSSRSRSPTPSVSPKKAAAAQDVLPPPPRAEGKRDIPAEPLAEPAAVLKTDAKAAPAEDSLIKAEQAARAVSPVAKENKAPEAETSRLHVGHLTRNVQAEHIQEIFSTFGTVKHVELAMDKAVNLPRGFAYVEFSKRSEAEEAQRLMDGGQLDGNQLSVAFVLVPRKPKSPPRQKPSSRALSPVPRRDSDLKDSRDRGYRGRDSRDGPRDYDDRRRRPLSPPRRRSSPMGRDPRDYRRDSRRVSPPRSRRPLSPRRRPLSPPRRRLPSPPRDRQRRRTPTRRSPARRRSRSPAAKGRTTAPAPVSRPVRGRSRSSSETRSSFSSSGSSSRSYSSDSSRSR